MLRELASCVPCTGVKLNGVQRGLETQLTQADRERLFLKRAEELQSDPATCEPWFDVDSHHRGPLGVKLREAHDLAFLLGYQYELFSDGRVIVLGCAATAPCINLLGRVLLEGKPSDGGHMHAVNSRCIFEVGTPEHGCEA